MSVRGTARDDEPSPTGEAGRGGSVVSGGHGIMQVISPAIGREQLRVLAQSASGRELTSEEISRSLLAAYRTHRPPAREEPVSLSDVVREAFGPGYVLGIDPSAQTVTYTDRVTGATFPEGDDGRFFSDLVFSRMQELREAYRTHIAEVYGLPLEFFTPNGQWAVADLDANEELIRSTRAEFSYDPHDYDMPAGDGMHWTPPSEGEDTPSCPA